MIESNMNLDIGFKGQLKLNAQVVPLQEGYLKIGGIGEENLPFGRVVSADDAAPHKFALGGGFDYIRGVTVFDDSIAQNSPAHPNEYLAGLPCSVLSHGFFWLEDYSGDVSLGDKVYFNDKGVINFSSGTLLENAAIRDIDENKGVLIYLN